AAAVVLRAHGAQGAAAVGGRGAGRRSHRRRPAAVRVTSLQTSRLLLRPWRPVDREPFAALNRDPEVMRYFPSPLDRVASDELADRISTRLDEQGWGLWAVEVVESGRLAGFTGLNPVPDQIADAVPGRPRMEVGWRLARWAW